MTPRRAHCENHPTRPASHTCLDALHGMLLLCAECAGAHGHEGHLVRSVEHVRELLAALEL